METKKWYQSKTIWGIVIAALGMLITETLGTTEIVLPENADFNQLKQYVDSIKNSQGNLAAIFGQIVAAIGSIIAIVGRVKAETKII